MAGSRATTPLRLRVPVYIGSRRRFDFPMSRLVRGATLFVEPSEAEDYRALHAGEQEIVVLARDGGGFGYLGNAMLSHARAEGRDAFLFCDDDVRGVARVSDRLADLNVFFEEAAALAARGGYSQVAMGFAGHQRFYRRSVDTGVGAWCIVLNVVRDLDAVGGYDEDLPIFNDWDVSGRLLRSGRMTARMNGWLFRHKMKALDGGAADIYRSRATMERAITMLQRRFGEDVVRRVIAHNQPEARFRWSLLAKG